MQRSRWTPPAHLFLGVVRLGAPRHFLFYAEAGTTPSTPKWVLFYTFFCGPFHNIFALQQIQELKWCGCF
jgi:hypothetical protein